MVIANQPAGWCGNLRDTVRKVSTLVGNGYIHSAEYIYVFPTCNDKRSGEAE